MHPDFMFLVTHAAIGALVGELFPNHPYLAFVLGFCSHLLTDIIPHGDTKIYKGYIAGSKVKRAIAYVMLDGVITVFFILTLFNTHVYDHRFAVSMGVAGGVLPDLLVAMYEIFHVKALKWFHKFHFFFHNMISGKHDLPFPVGFAMQLLLLVPLLGRLLRGAF